MATLHDNMDATQSDANVVEKEMTVLQTQNIIENENMTTGQLRKTSDNGPQQLDKFKRRLIRAVARLRKKNTPESELWQELEKEIGCDCRMLWQHMRTLTLKKLRRLLPANDLLENITKVARFTATDWLLFDLIMVHENVDVISAVDLEKTDSARNKLELDKFEEQECMHELFELVKEHNVESLVGDKLTEAWICITLKYNSRGRQVSPMLLQLRWYQMKELCRASFYNFWYSYRGNAKYLPIAMAAKPTRLQAEIVRRFSTIITQAYTPWENRIQERRVILSEEFTRSWEKKRKVEKEREEKEKENEIELIEPQVETIDLDEDDSDKNEATTLEGNDYEGDNDNKQTASNKDGIEITNCIKSIKTEVDDVLEIDGLSDGEATQIPLKASNADENTENPNENSRDISALDTEVVNDITLPTITSVVGNAVEVDKSNSEDELNSLLENTAQNLKKILAPNDTENKNIPNTFCDSDDEIEEILREKASSLMNIEITQIKSECDVEQNANLTEENANNIHTSKERCNSQTDVLTSNNESILCDSDDEINRLLQEKAEQLMCIEEQKSKPNNFVNVISKGSVTEKSNTLLKGEYRKKDIEKAKVTLDDSSDEKNNEGLEELDFDDDGIEFVDDGIEFVDDDGQNEDMKINIKLNTDSLDEASAKNKNENDDEPKIDLKLLMDPTVYTKKLDQMEVFKFTEFYYVNDKRVIDCAFLESKPVDKHALKEEDIKKFRDQAVLGYKAEDIQNDDSKEQLSEHAILGNKSDDLQNQNNRKETEYDAESNNKVKSTSWLLQKPKKRNYNPIQLCKNPDFNTRLKRFTAGFLSVSNNRALLKECKPVTIDLHKAFEKKLENNTLYLESGDFKSAHSVTLEIKKEKEDSIISSAITCQSTTNVSNSTENISTQTGPGGPMQYSNENKDSSQPLPSVQDSLPSERRKVIHLPDIDQVRRLNQSLLTAEVTPISIDNKTHNTNNVTARVQPILKESVEGATGTVGIVPVTPLETKTPEMDLINCKLNIESGNVHYQSNCRTDLIAHKINDQIIDISKQISKFDSNEQDKDRKNDKIKSHGNVMSNKFKTNINKKVEKKNTKYAKPLQHKPPPARHEISWMAKYVSNYFADSLLTIDTLNKILFLVTNDKEDKKDEEPKSSQSLELDSKAKKYSCKSDDAASKYKKPDVEIENILTNNTNNNNEIKKGFETPKIQKQKKQRVNRSRQLEPLKYKGIFCCWAREKISFLSIKRPLKGHGCLKFKCQCCCRHELNKIKLGLNTEKNSKKNTTTIVLSDDEDNTPQNNNEDSNMSCTPNNVENTNTGLKMTNTHVPFTVTAGSLGVSKVVENDVNMLTDTVKQIPMILPKIVQTNSETAQLPKRPNILQRFENNTSKNKCKTVVIAAEGHPYNNRIYQRPTVIPAEIQPNRDHLQSSSQKISEEQSITKRVTVITPEKMDRNVNVIVKKPKAPIFIGKNKILLCSIIKPRPAESPLLLPTLPNGVSFMLLPDGELTLSIAPGIELTTNMLRALPPVMTVVQDQLKKTQLAQNNQQNTLPMQTSTKTLPFSVNTIGSSLKNYLPSISSETIDMTSQNPAIEISIHPTGGNKNFSIDVSSDLKYSESTSITTTSANNQIEKLNIEGSCEHPQPEINSDINLDEQTEKIQSTMEHQANSSLLKEGSSQPPEHSTNDDNSKNQNDSDSTPINSRKSVLSDLMEMSGISAEDTSLVSDANENSSLYSLPPYIIPVTKLQNETKVSILSNEVPDNITIAGPHTNLLSFEPNTSTNYLLNCVGEIRPELNAVTSFAELKYACENDGKFYKLDIETGSIIPINVVVKKNLKPQTSPITKDVIDLTDDNDVVFSQIHGNENTNSTKINETQTDFSFQVVTQNIKHKKSVVKPLKLFKAVRRSVFKQGGKSIIKLSKLSSLVTPEKIVTRTQPQISRVGGTCNIELDSESNSSGIETEVPPLRYSDSSYDSSDDEPLAKKSRRLKSSAKHDNEAKETLQPVDDEMIEEEIASVPEIIDKDDKGNASDGEMNNMDIEGVNPELHPVAFEEGSESEDDMCILGV